MKLRSRKGALLWNAFWINSIIHFHCDLIRPASSKARPIAWKNLKALAMLRHTERKNWVILIYKVESLAELKFDHGFQVIGEYFTQIFSKLLLASRGRILVPRLWVNFIGQNDSIFSFNGSIKWKCCSLWQTELRMHPLDFSLNLLYSTLLCELDTVSLSCTWRIVEYERQFLVVTSYNNSNGNNACV